MKAPITKPCKRCGRRKPLSAFPSHKKTKDGYGSWCKACHTLYNRNRHIRPGVAAEEATDNWLKLQHRRYMRAWRKRRRGEVDLFGRPLTPEERAETTE